MTKAKKNTNAGTIFEGNVTGVHIENLNLNDFHVGRVTDTVTIPHFAFSPDLKLIASLSGQNIHIWESDNGKLSKSIRLVDSAPQSIAWSPKGNILAVQDENNKTISFCNYEDGKISPTYPFVPPKTEKISSMGIESISTINGEINIASISKINGKINIASSDIYIAYNYYGESVHNPLRRIKPSYPYERFTWARDQNIIASIKHQEIELFETASAQILYSLKGHTDEINCLSWSPDDRFIASGSDDMTIKLWRAEGGELFRTLTGPSSWVTNLVWSPNGNILYSCGGDNTIQIWDVHTGWLLNILEGHTDTIVHMNISKDGMLLVSQSVDNSLRIWRTDTFETIGRMVHPESRFITSVLDGNILKIISTGMPPSSHIRATLNDVDLDIPKNAIELERTEDDFPPITVHQLDISNLHTNLPKCSRINYVNAKAVLVGDSGVGKSGLGLVMTGKPFQATDSTHGRNVWTLEKKNVQVENELIQTREVLLWDLAGQPGYRLIHQLHLDEISVALVVFDSRSETDPFAGVRYWNRALRQAQRIRGDSHLTIKKILVASRADRGGVGVSRERLQTLITELGFDDYFETSAKENWGVAELRKAVLQMIDWSSLPNIISNELFQFIRAFLLEEKKIGKLLSTQEDLFHAFLKSGANIEDNSELLAQFENVIGRLESNGLIRKLSFGNIVLLQPELLDAYASFIINAARDEPEGLGSIPEEIVIAGLFRMAETERVQDREQEKLLLISAIEDMLHHEIALREHSDEGPYLVFPSQFTRERPDLPDPQGKATIFRFEGPILNIYTTLAVRLSHSGVFIKQEMWKSAAVYRANARGSFGVFLREIEEGKGELIIFYDSEADLTLRGLFEEFIQNHLKRRALLGTIVRQYILSCTNCGLLVTEQMMRLRTDRGFDWIDCPVCSTRIFFTKPTQDAQTIETQQDTLRQMDLIANNLKYVDINAATLEGKKATDDFDVFVSHSPQDESWVKDWLVPRLELYGIYVFQEKHFELGLPIIENIEKAVNRCPRSLLILSPEWLRNKWNLFDSLLLQSDDPANVKRRLIPILLKPCELPKSIAMLARADFSKSAELDNELLRVIRAIKTHN